MINPITILSTELAKITPQPTILLGSWDEISAQLAMVGLSGIMPSGRYPAILIPIGYEYEYGTSITHECEIENIPIYLITDTASNKTLSARYSSTYESVLYPLVETIEEILIKCNKFSMSVDGRNNKVSRKIVEHPYDIKANKDQNKVKDIVDCLELRYPSLKLKNINI